MEYEIDLGNDEYVLVPEEVRKKIIVDHLERYYIGALVTGSLLVGFLLGVIAYAL